MNIDRRGFLTALALIPAFRERVEAARDIGMRTDLFVTFYLLGSRKPGAHILAFQRVQVQVSPRGVTIPGEQIDFGPVHGHMKEIAFDAGAGLQKLVMTQPISGDDPAGWRVILYFGERPFMAMEEFLAAKGAVTA